MRSFLHIGLPKTGTTSLQEWLKLNATNLAQVGLKVVPSLSAHRLAVATLGEEFSGRADVIHICAQVSLEQALADAAYDGAIISSEYFYLSNPKAVQELFRTAGLNLTKTIGYLRRQDILCAACYAQDVKSLGVSNVFDRVFYANRLPLDWQLLRQSWEGVSQEVRLLNYDLHKEDVVNSFLDAIGAPKFPARDLSERFNVSLSAEMIEVIRLLNLRRQGFDINGLESVKGRYPHIPFGLSKAITREFEELYIGSNRKLAAMYPGEFDSYAAEMWQSPGRDFTGRVNERHFSEIMELIFS